MLCATQQAVLEAVRHDEPDAGASAADAPELADAPHAFGISGAGAGAIAAAASGSGAASNSGEAEAEDEEDGSGGGAGGPSEEEDDEDESDEDDLAMSRFVPVSSYPGLEFCGIVLTKLAQESLTREEISEFQQKTAGISAHQMDFAAHMREIRYRLNQVPTVLAAPFYGMIQAMEADPQNRLQSGSILALIRDSLDSIFAHGAAAADAPDAQADGSSDVDTAADDSADAPGAVSQPVAAAGERNGAGAADRSAGGEGAGPGATDVGPGEAADSDEAATFYDAVDTAGDGVPAARDGDAMAVEDDAAGGAGMSAA